MPRETGGQSRGHTNGFLMKLDIGYRLSMCVCMRREKEQEGKRARSEFYVLASAMKIICEFIESLV